MNIEQLGYAVEVAKAKSFSAASKRLHLSQSAVSQSIINLEEELGVKLYTRTRNGVDVTPEGQLLLGKAAEVLDKVSEMKQAAQECKRSDASGA